MLNLIEKLKNHPNLFIVVLLYLFINSKKVYENLSQKELLFEIKSLITLIAKRLL